MTVGLEDVRVGGMSEKEERVIRGYPRSFYVPDAEYERWKQAAEKDERSLSQWVRQMVRRGMEAKSG